MMDVNGFGVGVGGYMITIVTGSDVKRVTEKVPQESWVGDDLSK